MKFSAATIAAAAAFLPALVSAHLRMVGPSSVFASNDGKDQFPLDPSGSDYPCTVTSGSGGAPPVYEPGSSQSVNLVGSAVHGGGSCQISITYDKTPTKNSDFRVLKSFQGACPIAADGNLPDDPEHVLPPLGFTVPSDLPSGDAVLAWSWFNEIGNREMYMRCAPVTIGGSNSDVAALSALPEIFKANIGNGCSTPDGTEIDFPNPGNDVVGKTGNSPTGNCGSSGPPPQIELPDPLPDIPLPDITLPDLPLPGAPSDAPVLVEDPEPQPEPQPEPEPEPQPEPEPEPQPEPEPAPQPPAPKPPVSGGGSCVDGQIVCTSASTFAICNFGALVDMGSVAAGTECVNGQMVAAVKRSIRFSTAHMHRRHHY